MSEKISGEAELWLDHPSRPYEPGDGVAARWRLGPWIDAGVTAIEASVLWRTTGQGEEDFGVAAIRRWAGPELHSDPSFVYDLEAKLPISPTSYDGQIVKIGWLVRLRGFFARGRQRVVEAPFWLGPPPDDPRALAAEAPA